MWNSEGSSKLAGPLLSRDVCLTLGAGQLRPEGQGRLSGVKWMR